MRRMPAATATCRHCAAPLGALRWRVADHCEAPACRHAAAVESRARGQAAALKAWRSRAVERGFDRRLHQAPVVWLQVHGTRTVPTAEAERQAMAERLAVLAADPEAHPRDSAVAGYAQEPDAGPAADAAVCAFCRGRCCRPGLAHGGFVDVPLLRRWQARHGGTLAAAAAHYVQSLPSAHVEGSCLYHGEHGCVLPRDERAPVCNGFACEALCQARQQVDAAPQIGALLARAERGEIDAAAWLRQTGRRPRTRKLPPQGRRG